MSGRLGDNPAMVEPQEPIEAFRALAAALPQLIHAATQLPAREPDPDIHAPEISHDDWMSRFSALNAKLDEHADYWTTMQVHGSAEPEVVNLSLADDLADIWRDLAGGLALSEARATADAVWEWRFSFRRHWGAHAVEALRAIRAIHGN
jgi:hypothetical protein